MYVCVCHAVTDRQIRECANDGACKMRELRQRLGLASRCGKCAAHALEVLREATAPVQPAAANTNLNCC
jgi:bacterioferritin-associated ferredoxin